MTSLCHPRLRYMLFWLEYEAILGNMLAPMLFILLFYIRYLLVSMLSMGQRLASMSRKRYGAFPLISRLYVIKCFWICSTLLHDLLEMLQLSTSDPYKIIWVTRVSKRSFSYPKSIDLLIYKCFQLHNNISTLH